MKIVEWLIPALRTKLVYGQWILEHHANLNNFHVLAISLAAMDQKLLLFLVSEIQPHPCLFTSNPQFGLAFFFLS